MKSLIQVPDNELGQYQISKRQKQIPQKTKD
jgi:hypothetical protein